ncbi:MAG: T9SS type A sorting domain-containing protein, partial [bacterium]|nr:T9SS type A sorting domain-containing protein [bacterium]
RWEYKTQNWALNSKEQLYCGNPGSYLNDMDDTIVSHDFYIYPGSVCSIYIEAYLPSLEFIGSEPVFDLDGLFIKRIDQDKDTVLLEFISSGGALKSVQSMKIEGWRQYVFNESAPVKSKIFLNFISDSVITDSGVFIESIKVKPQFYYAESTYITRDDKNIIGKDIVKYALSGVTGQITAEIISIDGRIIKRYNFNETASASLSFENLPSGVYFVLFRAGRMAFKDKLIILK